VTGHAFRLTGGDVRAAAVLAAIVLVLALLGRRPRERPPEVHHYGAGPLTLVLIALAGAVVYLREHLLAAPVKAAPAPPVQHVTHTTIVQHVTSNPALSGWPLVAVVGISLAALLAMSFNRRAGE
jgi:hypothetical protein